MIKKVKLQRTGWFANISFKHVAQNSPIIIYIWINKSKNFWNQFYFSKMVAAQKLGIILALSWTDICSSFKISEMTFPKSGISSLLLSNGERVKLTHDLNTPPRASQAGFMLISYQCIIRKFLSINTWYLLKIHTKQCQIILTRENIAWCYLIFLLNSHKCYQRIQ